MRVEVELPSYQRKSFHDKLKDDDKFPCCFNTTYDSPHSPSSPPPNFHSTSIALMPPKDTSWSHLNVSMSMWDEKGVGSMCVRLIVTNHFTSA
jgi:hypothetical protein